MKIAEHVTLLTILWDTCVLTNNDNSSKLEISDAKSCILNAPLLAKKHKKVNYCSNQNQDLTRLLE